MSGSRASDDHLVVVSNLTKEYGDTTAVDDVSLSIDSGEIFGLLGPNGAGKTTIIKVLTTITPPTAGTAEVAGWDVTENSLTVRRLLDYVPQRIELDYWLSGRQTLELFGSFRDITPAELDQRIDMALDTVGLADHADERVESYSGGMRRRLEIASGLLHNPRLVILDEPTLGLDPTVRVEVWKYIERIKDEGTSILMATHYLDEADNLCDRVAIIDDGQVVTTGPPNRLKAEDGSQDSTLYDIFRSTTGPGSSSEAPKEVVR